MRYNFSKNLTFEIRNKKSVYYGSETISLGPKIWQLLPCNIKDSENLNIFKSNIKSCKPENCLCLLCKLYIADIGFIELYLVLLIDHNLFWYVNFVLVEVDFFSLLVYGYVCVYIIVSMCACVYACMCVYACVRLCVHENMCAFVRVCVCFFPVVMKLKTLLKSIKDFHFAGFVVSFN